MKTTSEQPLRTGRLARVSGFTLIELLTVIAIIGVLAGLMLPALGRAKEKARNIVCVGQLRQLGIAVRLYADEHENRLPAAELLPSQPANSNAPLPRICEVLAPLLGATEAHATNQLVFKCPSDRVGRFAQEGSSYEWNIDLNGRRMDETRSAKLHIIWIEAKDGQSPQQGEERKELTFPPETTPLMLDYEDYHRRPPQPGKNVVFLDGHVAPLVLP